MGSKIELTSVYGEGSEFYFVLEQRAEENETDAWDIKIPGIDIASAKQYYTDKEAFEECLQDYLNSIPEISEKIFRFRQN